MKKIRFLIMVGLTLGLTRAAFAATCVDSTCQVPGAGSITAHTITTISLSVKNSGTGTPNPTNSIYIMEATESGSPSNTADSVNGTVVIVGPEYFGTGLVGDTISGVIQPTVGGTLYNIYAKACPAGTDQNNALCSAWVSYGNVTTVVYPANPGFLNVAPVDTAPQQFTDRTNSIQDFTYVLAWQLKVNNADIDLGSGSSSLFTQQPWCGSASCSSGNGSLSVSGTGGLFVYANLLPNLGYTATNNLIYAYNKPGPTSTTGQFFTQPVNPVPITPVTNITHCAATLSFQNTASAPANPADSPYTVAIGGPVSSGSANQTKNIGGNTPTSQNSVTFTNLEPGTNYSPTVQVQNRGGGSWLKSAAEAYPGGFTTSGTQGSFSASATGTTTGNFTFSGLDMSGVTSWSISGVPNPPSGNGVPTSPIALSGLTPNTQYTVKLTLNEATCSFTVPPGGVSFTTNATAPTAFGLTAVDAFTLSANWTDGVNGAGTKYQVQYCTDSAFTQNCQIMSGIGGSPVTLTTGVNPTTQYWAHVLAQKINANGTDSPYSNTATATTPLNKSGISISPSPWTMVTGDQKTFTASVIDLNGDPVPNPQVAWSVTPSGLGNLGSTPASSITFAATAQGTAYLKGSITLSGSLFTSISTITINNSGVVFSVAPAATVYLTSATLTATASSQADNGPFSYTWSLVTPANAVVGFSPNGSQSASTSIATFHAAGSYTIMCTATDLSSNLTASQSVTFPINAVLSAITVSPNNVTLTTQNNQTFTAAGLDQFGNPINPGTVTWFSTGGNINGSGVFHSPTLGTNIQIKATSVNSLGMPITGSAFATIVNFDVSSSYAFPVPYKSTSGVGKITFTGLGSDAKIRIYTTTGRKVFDIEVTAPTYDWNVKNSAGENLASGVYLYVIESPTTKKNGKLIIIQ